MKKNVRLMVFGVLIIGVGLYFSPKTDLPSDDADTTVSVSYTGSYDLKVSEAATAGGFTIGSFYELSGRTVIDVFATIDGADIDYSVGVGGQFIDGDKQQWQVVGFTLPESALQAGGLVGGKGEIFFKRVVGE